MRKSVRRLIEPLESRLLLSAHVWTGLAGDGDTSNAGNWGAGGSPVGDSAAALIFPASAAGDVNFVASTASPYTVNVQGDYTLGGVAIAPTFINVQDDLGSTITVNNTIDGGTVEKLGNGQVTFNGALDGPVLKIDAGTVAFTNYAALSNLIATSQSTLLLSPSQPLTISSTSGTVQLGGAQLGLSGNPTSTLGAVFTLIQGNGGGVGGNFANLTEGSRITIDSRAYIISYTNDNVTITDVQHADASNADYVSSLYGLLLDHSPSNSDLSYWTTGMDSGQLDYAEVSNTILNSNEYYQVQVESAYEHLLNRPADSIGLSYWTNFMASGQTLQSVQAGIAGSVEFLADANASTNFVNTLFNDFLGRDASSTEVASFNADLNGTSAAHTGVAQTVINSDEGRAYRVNLIYETLLDRPIDAQGTATFVDSPAYLAPDRLIIDTIINSPEFLTNIDAAT